MHRITITFALVMLFLTFAAFGYSQQSLKDYKEGVNFELIEGMTPQAVKTGSGKLELASFMWYGCGSCYNSENTIYQWSKSLPQDVQFIMLPPIFGGPSSSNYLHARIFMTVEEMGLGNDAHLAIFRLFHNEGRAVRQVSELPEIAKVLKVDADKFIKMYNSPALDAKMKWLQNIVDSYQIDRVPMMVVNGKYRFDIGMVQGGDNMIKLAELLLDKEREARKAK